MCVSVIGIRETCCCVPTKNKVRTSSEFIIIFFFFIIDFVRRIGQQISLTIRRKRTRFGSCLFLIYTTTLIGSDGQFWLISRWVSCSYLVRTVKAAKCDELQVTKNKQNQALSLFLRNVLFFFEKIQNLQIFCQRQSKSGSINPEILLHGTRRTIPTICWASYSRIRSWKSTFTDVQVQCCDWLRAVEFETNLSAAGTRILDWIAYAVDSFLSRRWSFIITIQGYSR